MGVYGYATDAAGQNSGWQQVLTYTTFAPSSQSPSGSLTPVSGTGLSQVFTVNSRDVNGWKYIGYEYLLIGAGTANPANSCYVALNTAYGGQLLLMNVTEI